MGDKFPACGYYPWVCALSWSLFTLNGTLLLSHVLSDAFCLWDLAAFITISYWFCCFLFRNESMMTVLILSRRELDRFHLSLQTGTSNFLHILCGQQAASLPSSLSAPSTFCDMNLATNSSAQTSLKSTSHQKEASLIYSQFELFPCVVVWSKP